MHNALMSTPESKRLFSARKSANYESASDAARALGVPEQTYLAHENGSRGFKKASAERYARKFNVSYEWLYLDKGPRERKQSAPGQVPTVRLVGYVGAGELYFFGDSGDLGEVPAPRNASEDTVAVEIRGESLGKMLDRALAFYDNVQRPVTMDLMNRVCVVGLPDGRILMKVIQRSKGRAGLFHLLSDDPPILDVEIEWAAKVISIELR